MPRLFDLLSENTSDKTISSLRKIAGKDNKINRAGKSQGGINKEKPDNKPPKKHDLYHTLEFVALDLETTGLDFKNDRIIEIGAVRFSSKGPGEEFSTFVNPGMPIPQHITRLTGIANENVAAAPSFKDIAPKLNEFIADAPICGHQVDFDINFLNEEFRRIALPKVFVQQVDTALLSRIVDLELSRFTLGHVARAVGVPLENAHRALDDARASGNVALVLLPMLAKIPVAVRSVMAHAAPPSVVKYFLVKSLEKESYSLDLSPAALPKPPKKLVPEDPPLSVEPDRVVKLFEPNGPLSHAMKGFLPRSSQTRMAAAAAAAFNDKTCLVAEAGAGTGKSLAYLVPAAMYALKNNCRVLVSTHTRNLQDQLVGKDLPVVKKAAGDGLRFSVLKGRANYLCQNRFRRLLAGELGDFSYRERMGMLPLIRWAQETKTGDIEEQNQFNIRWFSRVWHAISAEAHFCEGRRCAEYSCCFLQQARQRALGSHIVVINHALFFSEICAESSFLGRLGPVVFDEAHHLEACGHRHLRTELDSNRCAAFLDQVSNLDKELKKRDEKGGAPVKEAEFKPLAKRLRADVKAFLDGGLAWAHSKTPPSAEFQLDYAAETFSQNAAALSLVNSLADVQDCLHRFSQLCGDGDPDKELSAEILSCNDAASQLKADLTYLTAAATEDHVFWAEGNLEKGWIKLCGVPLDVGAILAPLWEANESGMVFASATLSVCGSMEYFMRKVGLSGGRAAATQCEVFESPFSASQAVRCGVRNGPDVESPQYPAHVADAVLRLLGAFDKNILVLFTANSMLNAVYERIRSQVPKDDCTLLAQGVSGNRQAILDEFLHTKRAVLLGADSFWEGVDVPGKACEIVIIARLPFPVPTHPLTKALCRKVEEEKGESFMSYSVPEAVIRFRQGTGRLIRTLEDRGALVVLDNRVFTKGYGKQFTGCLDGSFTRFDTLDEMLNGVRAFFDGETTETKITYVPIEEV
ncbi:MAG TPA: helicase C-terminal domain-containing protein [Chitinivibrionales bacterium]|nr:helicase C-terminal domain-containing protein [Chitinivibrionales bacterium]